MDKGTALPVLPADPDRRVAFELPVLAALVPAAREFVQSVLLHWGFPDAKCSDAGTVVSELLTNAVRAEFCAGMNDPLRVTLAKFDWGFTILVEDAVPTMSSVRMALPDEGDRIGGLGMMVVDGLTDRAFWTPIDGHKVVGGEFRVPA